MTPSSIWISDNTSNLLVQICLKSCINNFKVIWNWKLTGYSIFYLAILWAGHPPRGWPGVECWSSSVVRKAGSGPNWVRAGAEKGGPRHGRWGSRGDVRFQGLLQQIATNTVACNNRSLFSQIWRPEVWNQGVCRAVVPLKSPGENVPCHFQSQEAIAGACGCRTPVSASTSTWPPPLLPGRLSQVFYKETCHGT